MSRNRFETFIRKMWVLYVRFNRTELSWKLIPMKVKNLQQISLHQQCLWRRPLSKFATVSVSAKSIFRMDAHIPSYIQHTANFSNMTREGYRLLMCHLCTSKNDSSSSIWDIYFVRRIWLSLFLFFLYAADLQICKFVDSNVPTSHIATPLLENPYGRHTIFEEEKPIVGHTFYLFSNTKPTLFFRKKNWFSATLFTF